MESHSTSNKSKPRVFRLRNLPAHVDRWSAVELLCQSVGDIAPQDVMISSLAYEAGPWLRARTQTATIAFRKPPSTLTLGLHGGECTIAVPGLERPLIVDDHFQGVTPLNCLPEDEHKYDCLVVSGLASHPFGSWQRHGQDKSFMWIRDELPRRLPGVRFLIYGYDTTLVDSKSFQTIPDLAVSLAGTMKAMEWSAPSSRPVLFLVHSLGGVILKQALVMLAGGGSQERAVIEKIKGAIFFGVPSQKMSMPDLFTMLGSQPNTALLKDLAESDFLASLDEQFGNISYLQKMQLFWAFETKVTPSVEASLETGKYARTGPPTVMVSRESATRNLCHSHPFSTIQIDENHSDMVKFATGDPRIGIILSKLASICDISEPILQAPELASRFTLDDRLPSERDPEEVLAGATQEMNETHHQHSSSSQPEWELAKFWDNNAILSSLRATERDRRLEQIDEKLGNTFNWAYDHPSTGLIDWLQNGSGIFWIGGKPASGKSTLMKFLYQDPRTSELLRTGKWKSEWRLMTSTFFFHHRGNNVQKSFEGLLRSIVSRLLEQENKFFHLLHPILVQQYQTRVESAGLGNLEQDLWALLAHLAIPRNARVIGLVNETVARQREWTISHSLGQHLQSMLKKLGFCIQARPGQGDEKVGRDDVHKIMHAARVLNHPSHHADAVGGVSEWPKPTSWTAVLRRTVDRHFRREMIKVDIERGAWSRSHLEDALRRLVTQQLFKMDLVLFVDALDEYDGRPEFIASFLQELVQPPSDTDQAPLTRTRILFSSRPWKAFTDVFSACPSFQIHDYTHDDIFSFCAASIPDESLADRLLSPLVGEIVGRARGVFLWVRLVMRDLATIVLQEGPMLDTSSLKQKLQTTLDSLPDELDKYYQIIIERVPSGTRWETYVVLETLCRSMEDVNLETLLEILHCSRLTTVADGWKALEQQAQGIPSDTLRPGGSWGEHHVNFLSEGLIEVSTTLSDGSPAARGKRLVQFMHQTVKEFVQDPRFKVQILRSERARHVRENGHSFIAKHAFVTSNLGDRFGHHARASETTMGFSQYAFFATAPRDYYSSFDGLDPSSPRSLIDVAVRACLQLCISDAYDADQLCIRNHPRDLVALLWERAQERAQAATSDWKELRNKMMISLAPIDVILDMARLLLAKGLVLKNCVNSLFHLLNGTNTQWSFDIVIMHAPDSELDQLAVILVEGLLDNDLALPEPSSVDPAPSFSAVVATGLIRVATVPVLQVLLARGVNPNSLDRFGVNEVEKCTGLRLSGPRRLYPPIEFNAVSTPIDVFIDKGLSLLEHWRTERGPGSFEHDHHMQIHQIVCTLVGYGGRLSSTKRSRWEAWLNHCVRDGFDCRVFEDAGFPLWCNDDEPEDKQPEVERPRKTHRSRLRYLTRFSCFS